MSKMESKIENIPISYTNLGVYRNSVTGEYEPNLPHNGDKIEVVDLKKVWLSQTQLNPNAPKGTSGMIFPFDFTTFYPIEYIKKHNLCGNGVVFVDVDCGADLKEEVFECIDECNERLGGCILGASMSKNGLHLIFKASNMTTREYAFKAFIYITAYAWVLKEVSGIDLRKIDKALDGCTFSMKQRLFLRYSKKIYWHDSAPNVVFDKKQINVLKEEYKELYDKKKGMWEGNGICNVKRSCNASVLEIQNIDQHPYIEHQERWKLFQSLCCCYSDEELWNQWNRCCDLIYALKHSNEWFKGEPIRNHWLSRWNDDDNHYCDRKLLSEFGYIIKDVEWNVIPMPQEINDLL